MFYIKITIMENVIYLVMLSSSNSFIENCNEYIDISSYSYIFCVVSLTFFPVCFGYVYKGVFKQTLVAYDRNSYSLLE